MRGLKGKRFIIGGGATGMGAALALRLAEEGARVLVGDINAAGLEALAATAKGAVLTELFDLLDNGSIERLVARAVAEFDGLDGVTITGARSVAKDDGRGSPRDGVLARRLGACVARQHDWPWLADEGGDPASEGGRAANFSICTVCNLCRQSALAYRASHLVRWTSNPSSHSLVSGSKPSGKM